MVKQASPQLLALAEKGEPIEQETQELTLRLVDESGERGYIDLLPEQVALLKTSGFIRFCGHCTQSTILAQRGDEHDYTAAEYHLAASHTYQCIAQSGITLDIASMIHDDELCKPCQTSAVLA